MKLLSILSIYNIITNGKRIKKREFVLKIADRWAENYLDIPKLVK